MARRGKSWPDEGSGEGEQFFENLRVELIGSTAHGAFLMIGVGEMLQFMEKNSEEGGSEMRVLEAGN